MFIFVCKCITIGQAFKCHTNYLQGQSCVNKQNVYVLYYIIYILISESILLKEQTKQNLDILAFNFTFIGFDHIKSVAYTYIKSWLQVIKFKIKMGL